MGFKGFPLNSYCNRTINGSPIHPSKDIMPWTSRKLFLPKSTIELLLLPLIPLFQKQEIITAILSLVVAALQKDTVLHPNLLLRSFCQDVLLLHSSCLLCISPWMISCYNLYRVKILSRAATLDCTIVQVVTEAILQPLEQPFAQYKRASGYRRGFTTSWATICSIQNYLWYYYTCSNSENA